MELSQCHAHRGRGLHVSVRSVRDEGILGEEIPAHFLVLKLQLAVVDPCSSQPRKVVWGLVRVGRPHVKLAVLQSPRNLRERN